MLIQMVTKRKTLGKSIILMWFSCCLLLVATSHAAIVSGEKAGLALPWPWSVSDLAVDPDLHYGQLANGFRYVVKKNQEPRNRVALFLYVNAGSVNEKDQERGLAHFLEHMVFKGTENFPAGSLVEFFQINGMGFGDDANAHTSYDQTVYNLILSKGSEKDLATGFAVMADYARRAQLTEEQINQERGVILAEKRARDSASYKAQLANMEFAFLGTKLAARPIIGVEDVLLQVDRARLKTFYDTWYRPENMILIVVGDMDSKTAEQQIEAHFSKLTALGPKAEPVEFGKLTNRGIKTFYHFEPELGKTTVSIETYWDLLLQNDSLQLETQELIRMMGTLIMGYRLQRLQEQQDIPFARISYSSGDIIERIGYGNISAQTENGKWQETLVLLDTTLRQAIEFGFTDQEVTRSKKDILAELDTRVLTAKSEDSRKIANNILRHLASNRVYQSAEQEKSLYGSIVENITAAQVNHEMQEIWKHDTRLISVTGDAQLGETGARQISEIYKSAIDVKIAAPVVGKSELFPYLPLSSAPAEPPIRQYYKDIDFEKLVFANGLVVNLKHTDFQENRVHIMASFGEGERSEPEPGMAMLAEGTINSSGSGQLPQSKIDNLLSGSSVELHFRIGETAFSWVGSCLTKDLAPLIQMLHTLLFDQGFREIQYANVREKLALMYQKMSHEIDGTLPLKVQPFLANGNRHFGLPPWSDVAKLDFATLQTWVQSFRIPRDLEITLVGDFNRQDVLQILEKYFGAEILTNSPKMEAPVANFPVGGLLHITVPTSIEKSLVVVAWPTEDFWNIRRTRGLYILANIIEDRVRKVIRENLGESYSPSVTSFNSRVYLGYGYLIAQVIVKPGREDLITEEILRIAERLQVEGVHVDELVRSKSPIITSITDNIRTNQYWLSSVLGLSSRYPLQLDWPLTIVGDFSGIDAKEVSELARIYLDNSQAAIAIATPKEVAPGSIGITADLEMEKVDMHFKKSK